METPHEEFNREMRRIESQKSSNPFLMFMVMGLIIFGVGQIGATFIVHYNNKSDRTFMENAQKQNIVVTRITKDMTVSRTRSTQRHRQSKNRSSGTVTEKTVYKVQYQYLDQGQQKIGGMITSKIPYFEEGDTLEAWVNPSRPTEIKIIGFNNEAVNSTFVHLGAMAGSLFVFLGIAFFAFLSRFMVGNLSVRANKDGSFDIKSRAERDNNRKIG